MINIVNWNVRGLGRPAKRFLVKNFLNLYFAEVCCLQESKLEMISTARLDKFTFVQVNGSAGGIIIGWNSVLLMRHVEKMGAFSLTVNFLSKKDNFSCRCNSVYRPTARRLKQDFWDELRSINVTSQTPWVNCGDFNDIFSLEDKLTGAPNLTANTFLQNLDLLEPPIIGRRFT